MTDAVNNVVPASARAEAILGGAEVPAGSTINLQQDKSAEVLELKQRDLLPRRFLNKEIANAGLIFAEVQAAAFEVAKDKKFAPDQLNQGWKYRSLGLAQMIAFQGCKQAVKNLEKSGVLDKEKRHHLAADSFCWTDLEGNLRFAFEVSLDGETIAFKENVRYTAAELDLKGSNPKEAPFDLRIQRQSRGLRVSLLRGLCAEKVEFDEGEESREKEREKAKQRSIGSILQAIEKGLVDETEKELASSYMPDAENLDQLSAEDVDSLYHKMRQRWAGKQLMDREIGK